MFYKLKENYFRQSEISAYSNSTLTIANRKWFENNSKKINKNSFTFD